MFKKLIVVALFLCLTGCFRFYEFTRTAEGTCSLTIYSLSDTASAGLGISEDCALQGEAEGVSGTKALEVLGGIVEKMP